MLLIDYGWLSPLRRFHIDAFMLIDFRFHYAAFAFHFHYFLFRHFLSFTMLMISMDCAFMIIFAFHYYFAFVFAAFMLFSLFSLLFSLFLQLSPLLILLWFLYFRYADAISIIFMLSFLLSPCHFRRAVEAFIFFRLWCHFHTFIDYFAMIAAFAFFIAFAAISSLFFFSLSFAAPAFRYGCHAFHAATCRYIAWCHATCWWYCHTPCCWCLIAIIFRCYFIFMHTLLQHMMPPFRHASPPCCCHCRRAAFRQLRCW